MNVFILQILISIFLYSCQDSTSSLPAATSAPDSNIQQDSNQSNLTTNEDTDLTINLLNIDYDDIQFSNPTNGILNQISGELKYTPFANYSGTDSFQIDYFLNGEVIFTKLINISVASISDSPITTSDSASTSQEEGLLIDVLANDFDPDSGDSLSLISVSGPSNGTSTISAGKAYYVPSSNFSGEDSFSYTVKDLQGNTATGSVSINVIQTNSNTGVPVRVVFIEKSDGTRVTNNYSNYSESIINKLNSSYNHEGVQKISFSLDSYDTVVSNNYYEISSSAAASTLTSLYNSHKLSGRVNIFVINKIFGSTAGIAYLNQIGTTGSLFETFTNDNLEQNIIAHEVGHNIGFSHTQQNRSNFKFINYTRCNSNLSYYQHHNTSGSEYQGWQYKVNLMYPSASYSISPLFTNKYDSVFTSIINCWYDLGNY